MNATTLPYLKKSQLKLISSESGYTNVPNSIRDAINRSKSLSSTEKQLFRYLVDHSFLSRSDEIENYMGVKTLAEANAFSVGTCSTTLSSLEEKGWIVQSTDPRLRSKVKRIVAREEFFEYELRAQAPSPTAKEQGNNQYEGEEVSQNAKSDPDTDEVEVEIGDELSPLLTGSLMAACQKAMDEVKSQPKKPVPPSPSPKVKPKPKEDKNESAKPISKQIGDEVRPISKKLKLIIVEKVIELRKSKSISMPDSEVYEQYLYAVTKGSFKHSNPLKAIRAIFKIFKQNKWGVPGGFIQPSESEFNSLKLAFSSPKQ